MSGLRVVGAQPGIENIQAPVVNLGDFYVAGRELGIALGPTTSAWSSLVRREVLQHMVSPPTPDAPDHAQRVMGLSNRGRHVLRERAQPWPIVFGRIPALDGHAHAIEDFGDLSVPSLQKYVDMIETRARRRADVDDLAELDEAARITAETQALKDIAARGIGRTSLAIYRSVIAANPSA